MVVDFPIDFVVTWVDDGDPAWRKEKNEYQSLDHDDKTDFWPYCRVNRDGFEFANCSGVCHSGKADF